MEEEKQELDTSEEEIEVEEKSSPEQPPMDEFALSAIFSDQVLRYAIQKLREGPIECGAFHKLLKAKFHDLEGTPSEYMQKLIQTNFVREFEFSKTKPNDDNNPEVFPKMAVGESKTFYLLVKDFYAIRKPTVEILEKLEEMGIPPNEVHNLRKEIEVYFKKYTTKQASGDDPDVIQLFQDQKMFAALTFLSQNVYHMAELTTEFKEKYRTDPDKAFKALEAHDFVKIISSPDQSDKWVVLKTAVELKPIFPEYLIRNVNQAAAERKIDKDFAILTLNMLKRYYLELEKPDLLVNFQKKAQEIRDKIALFQQTGDPILPGNAKMLDKLFPQLIDQYKQMGDIEQAQICTGEWQVLQERYMKK